MLISMETWRLLDHTADIALEARASSPEGALHALCLGLAAQVVHCAEVRPVETRRVAAEGVDRTDAVVTLLGEFLYLLEVERWLPATVEVVRFEDTRIELGLRGEPHDPARHGPLSEVKAATFHDFFFAPDADGTWQLRVIFDV